MVVQELIAKLGFDVDQGGLNSVDNALGNFAKKLTLAAAGLYAIKKAVDATVWAISGSIDAAAQKEDVTTQFKVMLGDLEAAKYLYQEINQYAAVTPFETAGLADSVKQMMSFGQTAKQAFEDIKMLGDVALGDQNKLNRLALVYSQTFSAKKLTGQDLLQYVNVGFNPLEYLSRKTGKSMADLRKEMEKGKITSDMVRDSFVAATSAGGKFYNGALEGSKTWNGMMSTLRDNVRILGAELGEKVLPFLKDILNTFSDLWDTVAGAFRNMADAMSVFSEGMPEAVAWATILATIFGTIADAVVLAMTTIRGFIFVFQFVAQGIAMAIGGAMDLLFLIPKSFASLVISMGKGMLWLGEVAAKVLPKGTISLKSIAEMRAGADKAQEFIVGSPTEYSSRARLNGGPEVKESWDKFIELGRMIGKEKAGTGGIPMSDRIAKILAGGASKQPVTINNQTNNLTINADDPIKMMGEAAAGRFFQSAFIQLRHATV